MTVNKSKNAGKGADPRPVVKTVWDENHDHISWPSDKKTTKKPKDVNDK
jgi:hypothetical protein